MHLPVGTLRIILQGNGQVEVHHAVDEEGYSARSCGHITARVDKTPRGVGYFNWMKRSSGRMGIPVSGLLILAGGGRAGTDGGSRHCHAVVPGGSVVTCGSGPHRECLAPKRASRSPSPGHPRHSENILGLANAVAGRSQGRTRNKPAAYTERTVSVPWSCIARRTMSMPRVQPSRNFGKPDAGTSLIQGIPTPSAACAKGVGQWPLQGSGPWTVLFQSVANSARVCCEPP